MADQPHGLQPRWHGVSVAALAGGYFACSPRWRLSERTRPHYQLWLICGGEVTFTIDSYRAETLTARSTLLLPPGVRQSAEHNQHSPLYCYVLHFTGRLYGVPATMLWASHALIEIPTDAWKSILEAANDLCRELVEPASDLLADAAIARAVGLLERCAPRVRVERFRDERRCHGSLAAALEYVGEHYAEPLSPQELAQAARVSPQHLSGLFRNALGLSPLQYLRRYRLDRARQLLRETSLSVAQVATAVGYRDAYYFSRAFHRSQGLSPSQYRRATEPEDLLPSR